MITLCDNDNGKIAVIRLLDRELSVYSIDWIGSDKWIITLGYNQVVWNHINEKWHIKSAIGICLEKLSSELNKVKTQLRMKAVLLKAKQAYRA